MSHHTATDHQKTQPSQSEEQTIPVEGEVEAEAADTVPADDVLEKLQQENAALRERAARAVADYQNLERRSREDRAKTLAWARETVFASLLQPLEHLDLAAKTLADQGLDMVVTQFWQTLSEQGLEKLEPVGKPFDVATMEAIEKTGEGDTVAEVVSPGFRLGEHVLRPAKVKVG